MNKRLVTLKSWKTLIFVVKEQPLLMVESRFCPFLHRGTSMEAEYRSRQIQYFVPRLSVMSTPVGLVHTLQWIFDSVRRKILPPSFVTPVFQWVPSTQNVIVSGVGKAYYVKQPAAVLIRRLTRSKNPSLQPSTCSHNQNMKPFGRTEPQSPRTQKGQFRTRGFAADRCRQGSQRKVIHEDELLKKNRRAIDHHIRRMTDLFGKDLSLNKDGMAFFKYKKFIIVIEVPSDNPEVCFVYTMVYHLRPERNRDLVLQAAMEFNYLQSGTRGATLGLDREEVNLCYSRPVAGVTFCDLHSALEDFLTTTVEVNEQLEAIQGMPDDQSYSSS